MKTIGTISQRPVPAWLRVCLLGLVAVRVIGVIWSAAWNTHGDYYASLPGTYVRVILQWQCCRYQLSSPLVGGNNGTSCPISSGILVVATSQMRSCLISP